MDFGYSSPKPIGKSVTTSTSGVGGWRKNGEIMRHSVGCNLPVIIIVDSARLRKNGLGKNVTPGDAENVGWNSQRNSRRRNVRNR